MKYLTVLAIFLASCHTIAYKQYYCEEWYRSKSFNYRTWHRVKRYMHDSSKFTQRGSIIRFEQDELLIKKYWK